MTVFTSYYILSTFLISFIIVIPFITGIERSVIIKSNLPFDVSVKYDGSTPGDVFGYTGNPNKLMVESGWMPKMMFKDGLRIMVNGVLENEK